MRLKKLTIQNFMSIREAEIQLDGQGLILIQGKNMDDPAFDSNGAGKSTTFEALTWVKYDKTVRGLSGDQVVNLNVGANCAVKLDFEDDAGAEWRIARYRKHKEHKNNCHIFKNGKNITPKSTKDANAMIESIFQMDFHTFTNSILFGQGLVKMFSVATDKEKKELLEKMLQMDQFGALLEKAKSKLATLNGELAVMETERTRNEHLISEIRSTIEALQAAEVEETAKAKAEIEELRTQLQEAQRTLQEHSMSDYSEQLAKLEKLRDMVDAKLSEFKEIERKKLEAQGEEMALVRQLVKLKREYDQLKVDKTTTANGKSKTCSACGQEIKTDPESIRQAVEHIESKIVEKAAEVKETMVNLSTARQTIEGLETQLSGKEKLETQKEAIAGEISQIQASIRAEANLHRMYQSRVDELEAAIEKAEKRVGKTYKPLIEEKETQLNELISKQAENAERYEKLSADVPKYKFWVEAFGNAGIKSYLLDSVTPFLNKKGNEYLSKLAGNTIQIEFSTQTRLASGELRDKFEVRILNSVGGDSYESNSTGERRRIDLAISLALQDLVMSRANGRLNVLLYDEIFDGLDAVGCENAIQLLHDMQKSVETIYVITHNDILKSYFDKFLVVTKENGATRVHRE
jgi:DNA repair exonuclease SbcCD ATPase subunit